MRRSSSNRLMRELTCRAPPLPYSRRTAPASFSVSWTVAASSITASCAAKRSPRPSRIGPCRSSCHARTAPRRISSSSAMNVAISSGRSSRSSNSAVNTTRSPSPSAARMRGMHCATGISRNSIRRGVRSPRRLSTAAIALTRSKIETSNGADGSCSSGTGSPGAAKTSRPSSARSPSLAAASR